MRGLEQKPLLEFFACFGLCLGLVHVQKYNEIGIIKWKLLQFCQIHNSMYTANARTVTTLQTVVSIRSAISPCCRSVIPESKGIRTPMQAPILLPLRYHVIVWLRVRTRDLSSRLHTSRPAILLRPDWRPRVPLQNWAATEVSRFDLSSAGVDVSVALCNM